MSGDKQGYAVFVRRLANFRQSCRERSLCPPSAEPAYRQENGSAGKLGISLRLRRKLKTTRLAKTAVNATAIIFSL
ncbi:hypothetical protein PO124_07040 [Bacillus licheniformis]|nr:hypothetical protein [Bacillus licheniformis]